MGPGSRPPGLTGAGIAGARTKLALPSNAPGAPVLAALAHAGGVAGPVGSVMFATGAGGGSAVGCGGWPVGCGGWPVGCGGWPVGCGGWPVGCGGWPVGCGGWPVGCGGWPVGCGGWPVGCGGWPVGCGGWPVGCGGWPVGRKPGRSGREPEGRGCVARGVRRVFRRVRSVFRGVRSVSRGVRSVSQGVRAVPRVGCADRRGRGADRGQRDTGGAQRDQAAGECARDRGGEQVQPGADRQHDRLRGRDLRPEHEQGRGDDHREGGHHEHDLGDRAPAVGPHERGQGEQHERGDQQPGHAELDEAERGEAARQRERLALLVAAGVAAVRGQQADGDGLGLDHAACDPGMAVPPAPRQPRTRGHEGERREHRERRAGDAGRHAFSLPRARRCQRRAAAAFVDEASASRAAAGVGAMWNSARISGRSTPIATAWSRNPARRAQNPSTSRNTRGLWW